MIKTNLLIRKPVCAAGIALALCLAAEGAPDIQMPEIFANNMILQRDQPVPIFGTGTSDGDVTVTFNGQQKTTQLEQGKWSVHLDPMPADGKAHQLVVEGSNTLSFSNVALGDVWLLSGQSNMAGTIGSPEETNKYWSLVEGDILPDLRCYKKGMRWVKADGWGQRYWYAEGYFFGRKMQQDLNIPIGLIEAAYVNTDIGAWVDPATAKELSVTKTGGKHVGWCFEEKVLPAAGYSITGMVWNQGENDGSPEMDKDWYSRILRTMITNWRKSVFESDFKVVVIQLPYLISQWVPPQTEPIDPRSGWAGIRQAQLEALALPKTAIVTTHDIGDGDIHPHNKHITGPRAALAAQQLMGIEGVEGMGPIFDHQEISGNMLKLYFTHADGLTFANGADKLTGMAIAGEDGQWFFADGSIKENCLSLTFDKVSRPTQARYVWATDIRFPGNLVNGAGLPAPGFRSDRVLNIDAGQ